MAPEPLTVATVSTKAIKWAWDHQDEIEPRIKKFYRNMRKRILGRHPGILVLGPGGTGKTTLGRIKPIDRHRNQVPGGTGKTTLGRILSGKYDFLIDTDPAYHQTIGVQTFRSPHNSNIELIVGPGQEDRRNATWPKLLSSLANGKELGVIHCCSFGYHSLSISSKHHKIYDPANVSRFVQDYTRHRRQDEIRSLQQISSAIEQNPNQTWLLTLVAKEDLWTGQDSEVREFYTSGTYGQEISRLKKAKGSRLFRHELLFGSMVIQNLTAARNELVQSNAEGYDHPRQVQSLRQIFETVAALQEWKAK